MKGWKEAVDENTGRTYYFNEQTLEVSWEKPGTTKENDDDPWLEVTDPKSGRTYFYNTKTKETSWTKPSIELKKEVPIETTKQRGKSVDQTTPKQEGETTKQKEKSTDQTKRLHQLDDRLQEEKSKASSMTEKYVEDSIHVMSDKAKIKTADSEIEKTALEMKLEQDQNKVEEDKKKVEMLTEEIHLDERLVEDRAKEIVLKERFQEDATREVIDALKIATSRNEEEKSKAREKLEQDKNRVQDDKETAEKLSHEISKVEQERLEIVEKYAKSSSSSSSNKKSSSVKPIEMSDDTNLSSSSSSSSNSNIFSGSTHASSNGMKSISFRGASSYGHGESSSPSIRDHYPITSSTSSSVMTTNVFVYENVIEFKIVALASAFALLFFFVRLF